MIIWSGKGYLVAVFVFGSSLIANLITNTVSGGSTYWDTHRWPLALALVAAGGFCWALGTNLRSQGVRRLIDPATNQEVLLEQANHSLFFIRMHVWGPILCVIAGVVLVSGVSA
jgi:hypothetical protein